MKPGGAFVRRLLSAAALLFLFAAGVYFFFPAQRIECEIMKEVEEQRLSITPGMRKTFLPGVQWDKPVLASGQGELLRFDRMQVRPLLLPLLQGKFHVNATALLGSGSLDADYGFSGKEALKLQIKDIRLNDIPYFKSVMGARAGGVLWSEGNVTRGAAGLNGGLKLEVKQLELSGARLGTFQLPDVTGLHSQGVVTVADGRARLESLTFQGEGIHMRLSGDLPGGSSLSGAPISLVLEIMPKPEFIEKQKTVFLLLAKFMTSPGVYRIPVRGTLLNPEIV